MRGKGSDSSKDTFYDQPTVPVSHLCRTDIANLDSECFMAGKRGSVGVPPNVLKQVPLYKSLFSANLVYYKSRSTYYKSKE